MKVLVDNIDNKAIHIQTAIHSTIIQPQDSDIIKIKFPSGANMTACETNLQVPKEGGISFTGSFSSRFVELFSTSIARHVTSTLNAQICPQVEKSVNERLTALIGEMDTFLEELIFGKQANHQVVDMASPFVSDGREMNDNGIFPTVVQKANPILAFGGKEEQFETKDKDTDGKLSMTNVETVRELDLMQIYESIAEQTRSKEELMQRYFTDNDTEVLRWSEVIMLEKSIHAISGFVNKHLDKGILLDLLDRYGWFGRGQDSGCIDCGYFYRGINGLIRNVTGNGQIQLNVDRDVDFVIEQLGRVSLKIQNITISGLDTFSRIRLDPEEPYYITPQVALEDLEFNIGIDMKVFPGEDTYIHGDPLEESFNICLNASSVLLDLKAEIGLLKGKLHAITMEDLFNGQVSFKKLKESVNRLILSNSTSQISFDKMSLHPSQGSDSLETSLDALVNNMIDLVLSEYDDLVSRSLEAAFSGPGLDSINKALDGWLKGHAHEIHGLDSSRAGYDMQDFFHFNESKHVRAIHDLLSSQGTVSMTNAFVACISYFIRENPLVPTSTLHGGMNVFLQKFSFENFHIDNQGKML